MSLYPTPEHDCNKGNSTMKKLLLTATSCIAISMIAAPANAQNMDYTSLTELFGEPVTTSATGKPQRVSEAPVSMEILTADDIRRSGGQNIPEVLRQVNGVNVVQKTANSYDVSIRGYNQHWSQRLLVLVNGRQVYLDHYGYTDWASIPVQLEEIRQIEVVKGPNTALFGFNAVNGVINIVTYTPLYDDVSSAGVTVGTDNHRKAHYLQSLKLTDTISARLSAGIMRSDDFNNSINAAPPITSGSNLAGFSDPESESLNLDTMMQVTDNSQLRVEISGNNNEGGNLASTGTNTDNKYQTRSGKVSYAVDSNWGIIKANIYKNWLDWTLTSNGGLVTPADSSVLVAQLEDTIQINPRHTIRLQGEYRDSSITSAFINGGASEVSYDVYALSGMWNWDINSAWSWTNAIRVDRLELDHQGGFSSGSPYTDDDYDQTLTEYSYNSGLVWQATDYDTLRLNTARGLEVPSLLAFGIDNTLAPGLVFGGDPRVQTSIFTNYELAWDHSIQAINGLFRSAIFYNTSTDLKSVPGRIDGLSVYPDNVGDSKSHGIELSLEGKIGEHIDWGIGYMYQNIDDDIPSISGPALTGSPKEFDRSNPDHHINLKLGYKNGPWELDGLAYYVSGTDQVSGIDGSYTAYTLEDIDGYVGANARIAYTFKGDLTLAVSGQQLLASDVQTSPAPDINRRVFVSLSKKF